MRRDRNFSPPLFYLSRRQYGELCSAEPERILAELDFRRGRGRLVCRFGCLYGTGQAAKSTPPPRDQAAKARTP